MKKNILILAALIAVVLAVPFLIIKADEAIQIKNAEFKDRKSTRLNSSHMSESRMPSSA